VAVHCYTIRGGDVPESTLPFSPALCVGPWVFVSGQASVDDQGQIVTSSFADEMVRSFDNLRRILAAANLTLADVVQVRSYVARQEDLVEYNQIYRTLFSPPYPARTTLVGCLGDLLKFEVDAVAYAKSVPETADGQ
jgi:2-iminobutanoate/2-iminopropanoate deaminase